MVRIASFNVENLFERPKAFKSTDWEIGRPIVEAYQKVNALFQIAAYTGADKEQMLALLVQLDIYYRNASGAIRRKDSRNPRWAWLRKNRGTFDREPADETQSIEIIATGRAEWIGWVELATEPVDETTTRMTARVIRDIGADIIGLVEVEDRPALMRFNKDLLARLYQHVMLIDGNDERGIDVAIATRSTFEIESIQSHVDAMDATGIIFSRDCAQYAVRTPSGVLIHVLVNHFKSKSGGGGSKRKRQTVEVRKIVERLIADGQHVVVLGDFNEGPHADGTPAANLLQLFEPGGPLVNCYSLPDFRIGNRPGTFDTCSMGNRFDYILLSQSLRPAFMGGEVFRKGLWGGRATRPTNWDTYAEIQTGTQQASDHAAVYVDLDL